jgi:3-oxoacyl-[acyl-carrier protein] reductase
MRVAIVTGGSRGIGRAVAERLAADGQAVVVAYASNESEASAAVAAIEKAGGRATTARVDVGDEAAVAALFAAAEDRFGGVDVVVNAAGVMRLAPLASLEVADLDQMYRTNIRGAFLVAREAARRVREGGAIINFSTSVTRLRQPTYSGYAASKAAMEVLSPILAKELAGRDVTANTVAPGPTATALFLDGKDQQTIDRIAGMNPMGRLGEPADIAEVVAFLAGPGRWINGQTIFTNGGVA